MGFPDQCAFRHMNLHDLVEVALHSRPVGAGLQITPAGRRAEVPSLLLFLLHCLQHCLPSHSLPPMNTFYFALSLQLAQMQLLAEAGVAGNVASGARLSIDIHANIYSLVIYAVGNPTPLS